MKIDDEVMSEVEFERRQAWSMKAGESMAYAGMVNLLKKQAADAFLADDMAMAQSCKNFAQKIEVDFANPAKRELNQYINGEK